MEYLHIPSKLDGFHNTATNVELSKSGRTIYLLHGELVRDGERPCCPECGRRMYVHGSREVTLRHLPFGPNLTAVRFQRLRYRCPDCGHTMTEKIPFKAEGHSIAKELHQRAAELLAVGMASKDAGNLTGLGKNSGQGHWHGAPQGKVHGRRQEPRKA